MGNALIGRLRKSLMDLNVPIWLNCPASELLMEGGGVSGVLARRSGRDVLINARKGVVLASGGFEHSQSLRGNTCQPDQHEMVCRQPAQYRRHAGRRPSGGAATALLDEACGADLVIEGEDRARALFTERSMPGARRGHKAGKRSSTNPSPIPRRPRRCTSPATCVLSGLRRAL